MARPTNQQLALLRRIKQDLVFIIHGTAEGIHKILNELKFAEHEIIKVCLLLEDWRNTLAKVADRSIEYYNGDLVSSLQRYTKKNRLQFLAAILLCRFQETVWYHLT